MGNHLKRKAKDGTHGDAKKKTKRQWRVLKKGQTAADAAPAVINPGDAGIWITCDMHKEGKCTAEARDIFSECASTIYTDQIDHDKSESHPNENLDDEVDIENEINREITGIKQATEDAFFVPVKLDIQCVLFFKTRQPIEPVSFVHKICLDAMASTGGKSSRWIKRLTPMTRMGKATEKGLEEVSKAVLEPHFHAAGVTAKKFAIRTTIRNNNIMKRDDVIKQVATAVGPGHSVDLKHYDLLILLNIYKNVLGMSVVGHEFEKLKRFNLAEIYDLMPRPETKRSD